MTNVIYLSRWKRGRVREGARPRYASRRKPDGLVSIGEISADIVRRLKE